MTTVDDLVLFGSGIHLVIARAENEAGATILSSTRLPGMPRKIITSHDIAFIACDRRGMAVVDFSDPRTPIQIGFVGTGDALDLVLQGSQVVVAAGAGGLEAYDVSDPKTPYRLWSDSTSDAWDIVTHRGIAYVIRDDGVAAADVFGPGAPLIVARVLEERQPSALAVADNHLFVTGFDRGLDVLDISHPDDPFPVGQADGSWSSGWDLRVEKGIASISNGDLYLLDVRDPTNPGFLAMLDTPGEALSSVFRDRTILVSDASAGIVVVDVDDPSRPWVAGQWHPGIEPAIVEREGDIVVTAEPGTLQVTDLSDPLKPVAAGVFDRLESIADVAIKGPLAYVADRAFGLRIIDLEDPDDPRQIGVFPVSSATAVAVSGRICALTDSQDLVILDVSHPSRPVLLGSVDLGTNCGDIEIVGDTAFLACRDDGVVAVDLGEPSSPEPIGWFSVDQIGEGYAAGIEVVENLAYVAFRLGGLRVLDVSNPARMHEIGTPQGLSINALDVEIDGSLAFVSDWHNGLWVFDISTPENATVLELLEDPGRITGAAAEDDTVVLAANAGGLPVFDTQFCRLDGTPAPMSWYPTDPSVGQLVQFTPLDLDADAWEWIFVDGEVMTGMLPGRRFRFEGSTTVTLSVTNEGVTETHTSSLDVINAKPRSPSGRVSPTPRPGAIRGRP